MTTRPDGMNGKEFVRRRKQLLRLMGRDGVAVIPAAPARARNRDVDYPYRQDSDFFYLSGFPEPESVAVISGRDGKFILFCRKRDPLLETWHGRRAGQEGARSIYGADEAYPIDELDRRLADLLQAHERLYYTLGQHAHFDQRIIGCINLLRQRTRNGVRSPQEFVALDHLLHGMRLFKSTAEIKTMREAARISAAAHRRAMAICRPGLMEYEVEAELRHEFHRHGAQEAYPSIVGGGANSCILHYTENNAELRDGTLLLIDAGAEVDCYAADITRTFPVNGRFNDEQKALYDLVLAAQTAAIACIRPGQPWNAAHDTAVRVLTAGLVRLGLLKGTAKQLIKDESYKRFYMHRTGHWLGMDVHDVGDYKVGKQWRTLEAGMVMTVEPGLYIPARSKGVAKKWWDIGIRIEDDVLVTVDGNEVLTAAAPKDTAAIEALMRPASVENKRRDTDRVSSAHVPAL